jgi:hypothetical protein
MTDDLRRVVHATDITDRHVSDAVLMRDGLFGGEPLPWVEIIDRLELTLNEDWGSDTESAAIQELKRRVRHAQRD